MFIAAIDGGATKTHCIIGDEKGTILSQGISSCSNYQIVGAEYAKSSILESLKNAASKIGISADMVDFVLLGLAGADMESDFVVLNKICSEILKIPFKIVNDCWIGLRAGVPENYGVVTVLGTGTNTAGRTRDGKEAILRSMSYELGNRGGGTDILRDALHFAFRSEEGTGPKTQLEAKLPQVLGYKNLSDMVEPVRKGNADPEKIYAVPPLVFSLASEGDRVCQDILINMGHTIGEMASGVIKKLGMEREELPVTLVGGLLKGSCPLLLDEYTTTVHRTAPYAHIEPAKLEPAEGAYLLALDNYVL